METLVSGYLISVHTHIGHAPLGDMGDFIINFFFFYPLFTFFLSFHAEPKKVSSGHAQKDRPEIVSTHLAIINQTLASYE